MATRPTIILIDPRGLPSEAYADDAETLLAAGYRQPKDAAELATATERAEITASEGGVLGGIKAGLEGAGSALSFGLSDWIERGLGVDPQAIEVRSQLHPVAHGIGTGAGILAPIALTGGAAALAEGGVMAGARGVASATAPALIARAGQGVTRALAPQGAGALRTVLAKGAGAATEGALAGAGELVRDAALDKEITPASAGQHILDSALLGGAVGGGLGAAEFAGSAVLSAARSASTRTRDWFVENYPRIGSKLSGAAEGDIANLLKNRERLNDGVPLKDLVGESRPEVPAPAPFVPGQEPAPFTPGVKPARPAVESYAADLSDRLADQIHATRGAIREAGAKLRPEESALLIDDAIHPAAASAEAMRLAGTVDRAARAMREAGPDRFNQATATRLEDIRDGILRDVQGVRDAQGRIQELAKPSEAFAKIDEAKRLIFAEAKKRASDTAVDDITKAKVLDLFATFKNALQDEDVWGAAGARQTAYNAARSEFSAIEKEFDAAFTRKVPTKSGGKVSVPDRAKIEKFVRDLGEESNIDKEALLARYQQATDDLHAEIARSADTTGAPYDRDLFDDLTQRSRNTLDTAQADTLAKYRARVEAFKGSEAERKAFAASELEKFTAAEDARKALAKKAGDEFKVANKARADGIKDTVRSLKSGGRWNGFMDIIGAGAVGHSPILAPLFVGYRAGKYLGSPDRTARLLASMEATGESLSGRLAAAGDQLGELGYARHALTQIAARGAPSATSHGIGPIDHEAALERPPKDVAEGIGALAMADLLSDDPGKGPSLPHAVGASVSPRLVEALGELQAKAYTQAIGAGDETETRRLLKLAEKLGYGGPFTSAATLEAHARRALLRLEDPKLAEDTNAIVQLAVAAQRADVDAGDAPLTGDVVGAAWSHGTLGALGAGALREIRNRYGANVAAAIAPSLRKAAKGPSMVLFQASDFHEEQAATRSQMDAAFGEQGLPGHVAPSPETVATLAVLARHAEDFARRLDASATAVITGKVPENLKADGLSQKETLRLMESVRRLAASPERLVDAIGRHTDSLGDHAPQTGQAAATTLSSATQFLVAALPAVRAPTLQNPEPGLPSKADLVAWGRKAEAILRPLETLAAGPSPDAVAALQAVYPSAWEQWRASVVTALATAAGDGSPPTYQTIQRVSQMIGQPLVPGQDPALLAIVPASTIPPAAPGPPQAGKPSKQGLARADFGQDLRTGTQTTMARG